MKVSIKKLYEDSKLPERQHGGDAGWDVYAHRIEIINGQAHVYLGIAFLPEEGHFTYLVPRSSLSKYRWMLANSIGVIDQYTGEVKMVFNEIPYFSETGWRVVPFPYSVGDRVGQLIFTKLVPTDLELVEELKETSRGEGGFGSSGK